MSRDAEQLRHSLAWNDPDDKELFLFSLLRISTAYDDGKTEGEEHLALYTPLPPGRVVAALIQPLALDVTYLLDCGRGNWWSSEGPDGHHQMKDWFLARPPRFLLTPREQPGFDAWKPRRPEFHWALRPDEAERGLSKPKLFERAVVP